MLLWPLAESRPGHIYPFRNSAFPEGCMPHRSIGPRPLSPQNQLGRTLCFVPIFVPRAVFFFRPVTAGRMLRKGIAPRRRLASIADRTRKQALVIPIISRTTALDSVSDRRLLWNAGLSLVASASCSFSCKTLQALESANTIPNRDTEIPIDQGTTDRVLESSVQDALSLPSPSTATYAGTVSWRGVGDTVTWICGVTGSR
jgi:hypothetical protein